MKLQEFLDYGFTVLKQESTIVRAKVGKGEPVYDALMVECSKESHKWMDTDDIRDFIDKNNLPIEYFDTVETIYEKSLKCRTRYYNQGQLYSGNTLTGINLYKDKRGTRYLLDYKDIRIEVNICDGEEEINRVGEFYSYRNSYCNFRDYTGCSSVKELMGSILNNHKKEKRETMNEYNKKIRDLKQEYKHVLGRMNNSLKNLEEMIQD